MRGYGNSRCWRGAALDRTTGPDAVFPGAFMVTNLFKQAAPANGPTHGSSLGGELFEPAARQNIALGNSREPLV
jgi:hypothetical protein